METYFYAWTQWHLAHQLRQAVVALDAMGIALKGDLPALMPQDSADVWAHRPYFDLSVAAGAPPDMFSPGAKLGLSSVCPGGPPPGRLPLVEKQAEARGAVLPRHPARSCPRLLSHLADTAQRDQRSSGVFRAVSLPRHRTWQHDSTPDASAFCLHRTSRGTISNEPARTRPSAARYLDQLPGEMLYNIKPALDNERTWPLCLNPNRCEPS